MLYMCDFQKPTQEEKLRKKDEETHIAKKITLMLLNDA